jgi:hypothetical protein
MNLKFDFFYENNIIDLTINVNDKNCNDIIREISEEYKNSIKNIDIYENNNLLNKTFNRWNFNCNYVIFINNNFINIIIKCETKIIKLPQLELSTKISEIKNILSIEGDIFFNNKKLDNKYTLMFYKINNNNILTTYQAGIFTSTS